MTDQNGQVVANYEYDAWGNVLKGDAKGIAAENPFGYAGYMYDKEIGMYYLIARYYNPEHGVFLSVDPDPDGYFAWMVLNAGFAAYDGYKAYKKNGWKAATVAVGAGLVGGVAFKGARLAYNAYKAGKFTKTYRLANKVSKKYGGTLERARGNGWVVTIPQGKKHNYTVRVMNAGSGNRPKPYYRVSHTKYGAFDKYGNTTNDKGKSHVNLSRKSYKEIRHTLNKKR
ncbi:RHS repeat-associated core domain-containing protein [Bacillus pacificus]|uniref:RHS repeat-associated core domain-containing protein n=1 Tax=Bacillus pacificus TaxID=2026187 RepID=UPI003D65BDE8